MSDKRVPGRAVQFAVQVLQRDSKASYQKIIDEAHKRGMGMSTAYIAAAKKMIAKGEVPLLSPPMPRAPKSNEDPIVNFVHALRSMGVIEFHFTEQQVTLIRKQTLEVK